MGVLIYSLSLDGEKHLSANFKVKEFANSQTNKVLVCEETIGALQKIRDHFNRPVLVSSGFRLPENGTSQHNKGRAADFRISGIGNRDIVRWVESRLNPPGLGLYDYNEKTAGKTGFIHIDYRTGAKARWIQTTPNDSSYRSLNGKDITIAYFGETASWEDTVLLDESASLREGDCGKAVRRMQMVLGTNADGVFGPATRDALKRWQKTNGFAQSGVTDGAMLKIMGIVGKN